MLDAILKQKNMTIYQCAKQSGVPYTTLSEVIRGKTRLEKCSAETVFRLSEVLQISMEELVRDYVEPRTDFEIFKSNVCHRIHDMGQLDFIVHTVKEDDIRRYWNKKWYPETFYLLAALDYLSRVCEIPLCDRYRDIRAHSLKKTLYPRDVTLAAKLHPGSDIRAKCRREAIPEFMRFNIAESEIDDVR